MKAKSKKVFSIIKHIILFVLFIFIFIFLIAPFSGLQCLFQLGKLFCRQRQRDIGIGGKQGQPRTNGKCGAPLFGDTAVCGSNGRGFSGTDRKVFQLNGFHGCRCSGLRSCPRRKGTRGTPAQQHQPIGGSDDKNSFFHWVSSPFSTKCSIFFVVNMVNRTMPLHASQIG